MSDLLETLRLAADDPMWADHAEVPKKLVRHTVDRIEALELELKEAERANRAMAKNGLDLANSWQSRAEAAEREVKELRAEAKEHKRLKNELVIKAYPAMDAIDEIAEGFRSAVHFVRNNAMNMDRDYPEICHAEEVFSRARAALSGSGSGWPVPDGWKLVPVEPTDEMLAVGVGGASGVKRRLWQLMLAASPAAPQQGGE